jgi:hypothetical protein
MVGLLIADSGAALAQVRLPTAPPPVSSTTAAPTVAPTQLVLTWPSVSGANGYRITYVDNSGMQEATLYEARSGIFAADPSMCVNGTPCSYFHTNAKVGPLYSYRVWAIFYSTIGALISDPGPVASATSSPYVAPGNLTSTFVPSTAKPGQVAVTVNWSPVSGASKYTASLTNSRGSLYNLTVNGPSVRFDPVKLRDTYTVCVYSIYQSPVNGAFIFNSGVKGCTTVTL